MKSLKFTILSLMLALSLAMPGCSPASDSEGSVQGGAPEHTQAEEDAKGNAREEAGNATSGELPDIPAYSGQPYITIGDGIPDFPEQDGKKQFEEYSSLDALGRCGTAYANICKDTMPTEKREPIGHVKPSGWHTVKYDSVDGKYLYNRCHLIGFQLAAENDNERNLITGTRYMNTEGMLPFENLVADYVKETGNHVLYRVSPVFEGDGLVARGVRMEAVSVEDDEVCFDVFCYNVQPGITIDYSTGESQPGDPEGAAGDTANAANEDTAGKAQTYILNTNTKKFHLPSCRSVETIHPENKEESTDTHEELIKQGYSPCGSCHP